MSESRYKVEKLPPGIHRVREIPDLFFFFKILRDYETPRETFRQFADKKSPQMISLINWVQRPCAGGGGGRSGSGSKFYILIGFDLLK